MGAEVREYRTRDLSLASYLAERGLEMRSARRDPKTRHFEIVLDDPEGKAEELAVDWANSCCRRHEQRLMSTKAVMGGRSSVVGNPNGLPMEARR